MLGKWESSRLGCLVNRQVFYNSLMYLLCNQSKLILLCLSLNIKFDLIVLSEIWRFNIQFYKNILDGYTLYHDLPSQSNVGGVVVFIRNGINVALRNDSNLANNNILGNSNSWKRGPF